MPATARLLVCSVGGAVSTSTALPASMKTNPGTNRVLAALVREGNQSSYPAFADHLGFPARVPRAHEVAGLKDSMKGGSGYRLVTRAGGRRGSARNAMNHTGLSIRSATSPLASIDPARPERSAPHGPR